jgi:hypothetical protein
MSDGPPSPFLLSLSRLECAAIRYRLRFLTDRRRPMKREWLGPLPGDHRSRAIEAAYLASRPNSARQVVVGRPIGAESRFRIRTGWHLGFERP